MREVLSCGSMKKFDMAKNTKNQSLSERFGPAVKAFLICVFIGGSGVGYVWQKNQVYLQGVQKKQLEQRLAELHRQNKIRSDQLAYQRSPAVLEARVRDLKLGLVPPAPEQIWTLVDAPVTMPASGPEKRVVAQLNPSTVRH